LDRHRDQLGSLATFAGLITAGVAVALQSVILAMVGYFFLIGRYGISVGDRVNVAGTSGEVIEVGLVRFYMMEYSTDGISGPTGRIASFSNSIVFQPTAGLFKQIPGTNFSWHEISLTLPSDSDYEAVEKRLRTAVDKVYAEYRDDMERQSRQLERTGSAFAAQTLKPASRIKLTPTGLEAIVRYPVSLRNAADIDDRVTRLVLQALEEDPKANPSGKTPAVKISTEVA
jgi:small-conductance mechanosensitive channel